MSSGPMVAALVGAPAGMLVDRLGAQRMTVIGLLVMVVGVALLSWLPAAWAVWGYMAPLMVLTAGYALFQAANNTRVMTHLTAQQRGVGAGLLGLSRNLGRITFGVATALLIGAVSLALVGHMRFESARNH